MSPIQMALLGTAWLLHVDVVSQTELPFFGIAEVTTRSQAVLVFAEEPEGLVATQTVCAIDVESTARVGRTVIPPAFVASLPAQRLAVTLGEGGAVRIDGGAELVGLKPDFVGELPRSGRHPAVVDQDDDGRPGMTVQLEVPVFGEVEVYVVQRAHSVLAGQLVDGRIRGGVDMRVLDQRTIGASNPFFKVNAPVTALPELSRFTLAPLASAACP